MSSSMIDPCDLDYQFIISKLQTRKYYYLHSLIKILNSLNIGFDFSNTACSKEEYDTKNKYLWEVRNILSDLSHEVFYVV